MDKEQTFEQAYKKLEEIATRLESPEISLEESIALFEEGIKLSAYCTEVLGKARQKIEILEKSAEEMQ